MNGMSWRKRKFVDRRNYEEDKRGRHNEDNDLNGGEKRSRVNEEMDGANLANHKEFDEFFETFSKEQYNSQLNNRYDENSDAPYIIHLFDIRENENLGHLHIAKVGEKIFKANITVAGLCKAGQNKYSVTFNNFTEANNFIDVCSKKIDSNWRAFAPDTGLFNVGIVQDIPMDIDCDSIRAGIKCPDDLSVEKVIRIKKKIRTKDGLTSVATDKVKILMKNDIPKFISIFGIFYKVQLFVPAVLRCYMCQRFGHGTNSCNHEPRCVNCGLDHTGGCTSDTKCANCNGNHKASDKCCSFFKFNRELNFIMATLKIGRPEAIFLIQNRFIKEARENCELANVTSNPYVNRKDVFHDLAVKDRAKAQSFTQRTPKATQTNKLSLTASVSVYSDQVQHRDLSASKQNLLDESLEEFVPLATSHALTEEFSCPNIPSNGNLNSNSPSKSVDGILSSNSSTSSICNKENLEVGGKRGPPNLNMEYENIFDKFNFLSPAFNETNDLLGLDSLRDATSFMGKPKTSDVSSSILRENNNLNQ